MRRVVISSAVLALFTAFGQPTPPPAFEVASIGWLRHHTRPAAARGLSITDDLEHQSLRYGVSLDGPMVFGVPL